jgi:hypothetical protein
MDNLTIYKSKLILGKLCQCSNTGSSSDLLSSSCSVRFLSFRYIKQKIVSQDFLSTEDLLASIREKFGHLSRSVFESVFDKWMIRFQICIDFEDSYCPEK